MVAAARDQGVIAYYSPVCAGKKSIPISHTNLYVYVQQSGLLPLQHTSFITDTENGLFEIKTLNNEYNCLSIQYLDHRHASASFLAPLLQAKIQDQSTY